MGQLFSSSKQDLIELQNVAKDQAQVIRRQHEQIMQLKRDLSKLLVENESDLNELENEIQALRFTQKISDKRRLACLEKIKKIIESELAIDTKPAHRPSSSRSLHQELPEALQQISSLENLP